VDLSGAVNVFLEALETPMKIGAGLIFVYGVVSLIMAFKEDNPQAKSSAIKSMVAGGILYGVSTQLTNIVDTASVTIETVNQTINLL